MTHNRTESHNSNEAPQASLVRWLGNAVAWEIQNRYVVPEKAHPRELSPQAKIKLWSAAVRLLEENRSYVDKAGEPKTDPSEDIGSHAA